MLVCVKDGTLGYIEGPTVKVKHCGDPPFEMEDRVAQRLIATGAVMEAASGLPASVATTSGGDSRHAPGNDLGNGETATEGQETAHLDPDQLQSMTLAELKKLAEEMGLYAHDLRKKSDVIALITAKAVEVEDGDTPPDIGAEGPVV